MLKSAAKNVKTKWQTASGQIEYIEDKVKVLTTWTGSIQENLKVCEESLHQSDLNHIRAREIMESLEGKLDGVEDIIIQIQPYIDDAEESEEILSDKFSEINVLAQEAVQMANEHMGIRDEIRSQLETAIDDARNSIDQINTSIDLAKTLTIKVTTLRDRLPQIRERLNDLDNEALNALRTTHKAKSRANQILGKTNNIDIEDYNVNQIVINADILDKLVEDIRPQIESLEQNYMIKEEEITQDIVHVQELYLNAERWQQEVDKLLAEVLKSKHTILDSHKHFTVAKEMSENFFIKQEEADLLWENFDGIKTDVEEAQSKVRAVRGQLQNLYDISTDAHETAKQAESEVNRLTLLSGENGARYEAVMQELDDTSSKIGTLQNNVDAAMSAIQNRKQQIDYQLEKTNAARTKAQEARSMSTQAMTEGTDTLKMLRIIMQAIEMLPDEIEREDELEQLEEDLNFIEQTLNEAQIGTRIHELRRKNSEVKSSLESFSTSSDHLLDKKNNLQEILLNIPNSCPYKSQQTEDISEARF